MIGDGSLIRKGNVDVELSRKNITITKNVTGRPEPLEDESGDSVRLSHRRIEDVLLLGRADTGKGATKFVICADVVVGDDALTARRIDVANGGIGVGHFFGDEGEGDGDHAHVLS